jgi:hypothetical protein
MTLRVRSRDRDGNLVFEGQRAELRENPLQLARLRRLED